MKKSILLLTLSLISLPLFADSPTPLPPPFVSQSLEFSKYSGLVRMLDQWHESPALTLILSPEEKAAALNQMASYAKSFGFLKSYDIIAVNPLADDIIQTYVILRFGNGLLFLKVDAYHNGLRWLVTDYLFSTQIEAVFPETLIVKTLRRLTSP